MARMTSSASQCIVQGDCFFGNTSVLLHNSERLQFAACGRMRVARYTKYRRRTEIGEVAGYDPGLYDVNAREQGMGTQART